jgi:hypothetical protein
LRASKRWTDKTKQLMSKTTPRGFYSLECLVIFLFCFKEIHFLAISHLWPFLYINWTLVVWHNSIFVLLLQIWHEIYVQEELQIIQTSSNRFLVISYVELKKWTFTYWFAFPGLVMIPHAITTSSQPASL